MGGTEVLSTIRAVLLDLDGVMYRGTQLCHGASEFVAFIRERGLRPFYLSNNSRSGPDVVARKLTELGIPTASDEVVTAAELTVEYLGRRPRKDSVLVIGSDWLASNLEARGWRLANEQASCVVVGLDHQLTYLKLQMGVQALLEGATFVGVNRDPVNPIEGTLELGCGSIVKSLESATSRRALCMGKPSLTMLHKALRRLDLQPQQTLMVGDSLVSDMVLARRGGTHSALLLSGQTSRAMADRLAIDRRPTLILDDLAELHALWSGQPAG